MKVRYIVLNGPPSSGKSTLARELSRELSALGNTVALDSFAAPLKHFFAAALGDSYQTMNKEKARPELNGYSLREAWIDLAEQYMKKRYGEDCFGKWLVHRSLRMKLPVVGSPKFVVIDDGGFEPELWGLPKPLIVRVTRPTMSWIGDSRGYYSRHDLEFANVGTPIDLYNHAKTLAEAIVVKTDA